MKKHTLQFTLAMILAGSTGSTFAADPAPPDKPSVQVVVTGRVTDATCDISPQGLAGNKLDLGAYAPTVFSAPTTLVGTKQFQIGLTNCTDATGTPSADAKYGLDVSGDPMAGHTKLFADIGKQTVGIQLDHMVNGAPENVPASGAWIPLSTDNKAASGDGAVALFQASMVSPFGPNPAVQDVQGTILFVADYK